MRNIISNDDSFLNLKQVISKVAIQKSKSYDLISNGEFPAPIKIGTMSRWSQFEIVEWMNSYV